MVISGMENTHKDNWVSLVHEVVSRPRQAAGKAAARDLVVDINNGIRNMVPE